MNEIDIEEKKNKRTGLVTTIGFHVVLLILFFFLLAWSEPDPPIPQYGIELSFVQSNSKGKVESEQLEQSQQESADSKDEAQEPQEEEPLEEAIEEQVEDVVEDSEPVENIDEVEELVEEVPIEDVSEPTEESEKIESEDVNSPDIVEEKKEEKKKEEEKPIETPKENSAPAETNTNNGSGESKSEDKPATKPAIDSRAIYKGSKGSTNSQSSSGGSSLNMSGWAWDFEPGPDDNSDESGKIIFKITVDDEGEILRVTTIEKTVSPVVEKKYKDAVMDLTFSKTAENRSTATTSSGIVTFTIKSR